MITFDEMCEKLAPYFNVDIALEQGFSNGKYTRVLAKYAKKVIAIDVSPDFLQIAKNNLKDLNNIELKLMNAEKTSFSNKYFGVLLNTSFHEFDLSTDVYSIDLELKEKILKEMIRLSNTIVFIEPSEKAITNELFKVFNPNEKHSDRIKQSNMLIDKVMSEEGYDLILCGNTYNEDIFSTQNELEEEMLNWWSDIRIPKDEVEKQSMIKEINLILENGNMLKDLTVIEDIQYRVFQSRRDNINERFN